MMTAKENWVEIADDHIRHIWQPGEGDDCQADEYDAGEVAVSPNWYRDNGTPNCGICGKELVYIRSEISPDFLLCHIPRAGG
jgi:hypothetical protein